MDDVAKSNWERYTYCLSKGHSNYVYRAARLEGFYLGGNIDGNGNLEGGGQWTEADLAILHEERRPAYEFNEIRPSVNAAIGHQIHNRMDVSFKPAGSGGDQVMADIRSKLAMFICGQEKFHYKETQVFSDGLIEQRGYFNIRIRFDANIFGDASIEVLDPRDVIPDPDAKSYDPDTWSDVIVCRWLALDEVEEQYGKDKRDLVENTFNEGDFGQSDQSGQRNTFGIPELATHGWANIGNIKRVRVIERQQFKYEKTSVAIHPTGDIQVVENAAQDVIDDLVAHGCVLTKKMTHRVRWTVSTRDVDLFDEWSPFPWLTVLPYFPYFRRGMTRGMVDAAIGAQQVFNKGMSQNIHIVNTTANSGWHVEQGSLSNMDTDDLAETGAKSGLVLEHKKGAVPPQKIQPNQVPTGIDRLIERSLNIIKEVTVPEAMRGEAGPEVSGVAIQSKQFASQQQLAVPLDNLAMTRNILGVRLDWIMSNYYDTQRVIRITETDPVSGKEVGNEITINQPDGRGGYLNDMTVGKYDVVVSEVPMQVTFENSQFTQTLEMRKAGIMVPDWAVIKHSNLSDKAEILGELRQQQQQAPDPLMVAKTALIEAQTKKADADTGVSKAQSVLVGTEAAFAAMQAGQAIATMPQIAPIADIIMEGAGYQSPVPAGVDPNFPQPQNMGVPLPDIHQNTSPQLPPVPRSPLDGIETTRNEGAP